MALNTYDRELKKIFDNDAPAKPTTRTRAEIEDGIAEISAALKGPLTNAERLNLVEDRRELRKQLEALT